MSDLAEVWVVTRWEWGGGGDDETVLVGVFASEEAARSAHPEPEYDIQRFVVIE